MTNEQLKEAIAIEATRRWKERGVHFIETLANIAVELTQEGWTPPVAVDPDLAEAETLWGIWLNAYETPFELAIKAIKRGRALAAAEAKPGLVWVKHDGSNHCPVDPDSYVWVKRWQPLSVQTAILMAVAVGWHSVTHYAIITPPDDVA